MSSKILMGFEGKFYSNSGSVYATPTWAEEDTIKNIALVLEGTEADITMRRGKGFKSSALALIDMPLELEMVYEQANTNQQQFFACFMDRQLLMDCLILDGPVVAAAGKTASKGMRSWLEVMKWELGQEIEGVQMLKVSCKPGWFAAGEQPKPFTGTVAP